MPIGLQSPNFGNSIVQIFCVTFILISGHEFAVLQMGVDCSRASPKTWRDVVMMMMHQKAI